MQIAHKNWGFSERNHKAKKRNLTSIVIFYWLFNYAYFVTTMLVGMMTVIMYIAIIADVPGSPHCGNTNPKTPRMLCKSEGGRKCHRWSCRPQVRNATWYGGPSRSDTCGVHMNRSMCCWVGIGSVTTLDPYPSRFYFRTSSTIYTSLWTLSLPCVFPHILLPLTLTLCPSPWLRALCPDSMPFALTFLYINHSITEN